MVRTTDRKAEGNRAVIYARVSDKSQDGEDKTSISEQIVEMEAHCESRGLTIVARYQEVGRGWSKKRPEFQRMLTEAREGRFDVIVCWKSDRLSRGMYPAAALMEVVEAHEIRLEAVMDAIDMKTFGLMAAIGKIELDNFRLGNASYRGSWFYGKYRHVATEDGVKVHEQPRDRWIEIPIPQVIDDETWERAQALKKQRSTRSKRNTKVLYLLQHLLKCGECGHSFHAKSTWRTNVRNGKKYRYDLPAPNRYYKCGGMHSLRLRCRERPYIRAERLEEPIWREVKRVIQNPGLIVAGIDTLDTGGGVGLEEEITQAERDVRGIQMEEDRTIRLFVSGKITEAQLDVQRKFITERLESARAKLDEYHAREAIGAEKRRLMETVLAWARNVGQGIDELTDEQRKEILQVVLERVVIDRENNVDITLAIPIDAEYSAPHSPYSLVPEPESVAIASKDASTQFWHVWAWSRPFWRR